MSQYELDFDAGLTDQFPAFHDCLSASIYSCGKPFKNIAADLNLSSSHLSRMLNEADEGANFPAHRLPDLIHATGDLRPVYWLVETFCRSEAQAQQQAVRQLVEALPRIQAALKQLNGNSK